MGPLWIRKEFQRINPILSVSHGLMVHSLGSATYDWKQDYGRKAIVLYCLILCRVPSPLLRLAPTRNLSSIREDKYVGLPLVHLAANLLAFWPFGVPIIR